LDRSPKKSRGVTGTTASMEAIPSANSNARHSAAFTSSAVTSPTTPPDEHDQRPKAGARKPVGGIAVLPPMEMKRIEDQRKTPTPTPGATEPKQRPFSAASLKSPTSETSEVCSRPHSPPLMLTVVLFVLHV